MLARDPSKLIFSGEPVSFVSVFVVLLMTACFVVSVLMDNYSQVDRWWSVLPPLIVGFYWYRSPVSNPRLTTMFALSLLWGIRLTYNFWRKGGYHYADEDYRWQPLKQAIKPYALWLLFNIFFICIFQITLLFLIASPADIVYHARNKVTFDSIDALLMFAFLFLLSIESIADQQQWIFQNEKYRRIEKGLELTGDFKRGFLTSGLFQFSRHPNFFSEISMWWVMYAFGAHASGQWLNWTVIGPILLTALFQGSTNFTERLTLAKYPKYAQYQQTTSRLLPLWPGSPANGNAAKSPSKSSKATTAAPGSPKPAKKTTGTKATAANTPVAPAAPAAATAPEASADTLVSPKSLKRKTVVAKKLETIEKETPNKKVKVLTKATVRKPVVESDSSEEEAIVSPSKRGGAKRGAAISSPKGRRK